MSDRPAHPFANLMYEKTDGVAVVTFNRPKALNALSRALFRELGEALEDVERDDETRVLVITGAPRADGRPCFSAGGDLKEIADEGLEDLGLKGPTLVDEVEALARLTGAKGLASLSKPTIAAIDGICTAGGIELAEACDLRIVSETAAISDLHIKNLGISAPLGTAWLPRIVGVAKAKELMLTGDVIDGREAWRIGFANQVVPPGELMEHTMNLARKIARMDPIGVRLAKAAINASVDTDVAHALAYSRLCFAAHSPMHGINDFAGRSTPES